jgi:hypothetical protein
LAVFAERVPKAVFGSKGMKQHGLVRTPEEELRNMYSAPNSVRVTESRRKRWARTCSTNGTEED